MQRIQELNLALAEVQRLGQMRATLSDTLSRHALRLKSSGSLPPEDLLNDLLDYRTGLCKLSAELMPTQLPRTSAPADTTLWTLDAAQSAITNRMLLQRGHATLLRIAALKHVDNAEFTPLAQCQSRAANLLRTLQAGVQQTSDITTRDAELRPFESLLKVVDTTCEVPDAEWTECHALVTATWGRALSTAIARGRICEVTDEPVNTTPANPEFPAVGHDCTEHESAAEKSTPADSADSPSDSIFDTAGDSCTERSPSRSYRSRDLKLLADEPFRWIRSGLAAVSVGLTDSQAVDIEVLARRALEATPTERATSLSQVILQLLSDDHPGLAYYLRQSQESLFPATLDVPPSPIIHALALCRQMCYSRGEMARQIEVDLETFTPELLATGNADSIAASGFFLRAAALLPALLNASPAAIRILKSFRIEPGLSHLYNYCGRIMSYGQQLQGQAADLFTPDCDWDHWEDELDDLQRSITSWMVGTTNRHCQASKTSPLFLHAHWTLSASTAERYAGAVYVWSKWQEAFRLVQTLLEPVRKSDESQRLWVKSEVDRLANSVQVESQSTPRETMPPGTLLFPDEEMTVVIRQGMSHANRWLRLCASKPNQGRTLISREAEILKDEILERTDSVLDELSAHSQIHQTPAVRSSIACLCRTIEHLRLIFSPQTTLALREPDPQEILVTELQRIPQLELNAAGQPALDAEHVVNVLLSHLSSAVPDVPPAFSAHSAASALQSKGQKRLSDRIARQAKSTKPGPLQNSEPTDTCWE